MEGKTAWPATVVAVAFLALLGLMFWRATASMDTFDKTWAAAGPIVGVVVGAVPGLFFGVQSRTAERRAHARAEVYAGRLEPEQAADTESRLTALR